MINLTNFKTYTPDDKPFGEGVVYLRDDSGLDWYTAQAKFKPDTCKLVYDTSGMVIAQSNDVSALYPLDASVLEVAATKDNLVGQYVMDGVLVDAPPSDLHEWNRKTKSWSISTANQTALLALHRQQVWEKIKQKRHDNLRAGCFVKSVGKWFHSNDESRQQYIFMRTLSQLPPDLMWKTMDNTFVKVTKELLDELSMQLLVDEQADFANAERHKEQMERAENPLEYDYSTGWSNTYAD